MSLITFPSPDCVTDFSLVSHANQRAFASPFGGSEQVVDMLNDRWHASLTLPPANGADSAKFEAFLAALRGQVNHTELHHFGRPVPLGTITGSPTAQAAAQGAASVVLNTTTGHTLLAGDMIGISGMLLQVAADCVSVSGAITVPLVNRLRTGITAGAAVTLTRPTAPFRLVGRPALRYVAGYSDGLSLDFVEKVD